MKKRFAASALLVLLSAGICARIATAQIRFTPIQLYVQFRSMSNRAKPQGEVKARLAEIEKNATAAFRAGKTGEVRRLFAQGRALLQGKSWARIRRSPIHHCRSTPGSRRSISLTTGQRVRFRSILRWPSAAAVGG